MKNIILAALAFFMLCSLSAPQDSRTAYLQAFANAYGYVKYFHPSDEASAIDWKKFAAYGADEIIKCQSKAQVIATLNNLFQPIAPSVRFTDTQSNYDLSAITPVKTKGYETTYWQHRGVSKDMNYKNYVYKSRRVNKEEVIDEADSFGNISQGIDASPYARKRIKYTGSVKLEEGSDGTGHLWLRVDLPGQKLGFFDNMGSRPIRATTWQSYEIIGEVDSSATNIVFGSFLNGKGTLYLDDIHLYYEEDGAWIEIPIQNGDFEAPTLGTKDGHSDWSGNSVGYAYQVSTGDPVEGKNAGLIAYQGKLSTVEGKPLFEAAPAFGELIDKEIGKGIYCQIPLVLYTSQASTYPESNRFEELRATLASRDYSENTLGLRLGNVINAYNVMRHFYPYFDQIQANWEEAFRNAIERSFSDSSLDDHLATLQKLNAALQDGHGRVWFSRSDLHTLPLYWEWVENQLLITEVLDDAIGLKRGDIVTAINGQTAAAYFAEVQSRISAGTKGWLEYRARTESRLGNKGDSITLQTTDKAVSLVFDRPYEYTDGLIAIQENEYKQLEAEIMYVNLDKISMDSINAIMPQLEEAKGIIFDMRGYPNNNHEIISHLLTEKDTTNDWMRIPLIIYPDQENIVGYDESGWSMEPQKPYLGDKKVVFITDGRAISYAESIMGFIEGYDLATIVGQPTAGANGNINPFDLLGEFGMNWTGMKVFKHNGSQHHAVGVTPDIYVKKTIEGVLAGRDEFLEKAIEVVNAE